MTILSVREEAILIAVVGVKWVDVISSKRLFSHTRKLFVELILQAFHFLCDSPGRSSLSNNLDVLTDLWW